MKASNNAIPIIGNNAPIKDFLTRPTFDLLNSNSNAPSSTIKTRPIVANIGNSSVKLGRLNFKSSVTCFIPQPSNKSKITEGMLVLEAVRLNM